MEKSSLKSTFFGAFLLVAGACGGVGAKTAWDYAHSTDINLGNNKSVRLSNAQAQTLQSHVDNQTLTTAELSAAKDKLQQLDQKLETAIVIELSDSQHSALLSHEARKESLQSFFEAFAKTMAEKFERAEKQYTGRPADIRFSIDTLLIRMHDTKNRNIGPQEKNRQSVQADEPEFTLTL
jgi:hypothetical protein